MISIMELAHIDCDFQKIYIDEIIYELCRNFN